MNSVDTAYLAPLLALAAWLLALSLFVQVIQELYKFTTSSKSRAYESTLADFFGSWVGEKLLLQATNLGVRGPFQFRGRAGVRLLPMDKDQLIAALENGAGPALGRALRSLTAERELQGGTAKAASPEFQKFLESLGGDEDGVAAIDEWLRDWHTRSDTGQVVDAAALVAAFRREFLPNVLRVEEQFGQFTRNYEYAYRRRNLRQTFVLALITAVVLDLPFQQIYAKATALSPEEAMAVARQAMDLYDKVNPVPPAAEATAAQGAAAQDQTSGLSAPSQIDDARRKEELQKLAAAALDVLCRARTDAAAATTTDADPATPQTANTNSANSAADSQPAATECAEPELFSAQGLAHLTSPGTWTWSYFLGSLLTAVLVSFGAPFWNDLLRALGGQRRTDTGPVDPGTPRTPAG